MVLGAGGASRAICVECALAQAESITVVNIAREQGEELVRLLNEKTKAKADFIFWNEPVSVKPNIDILVNATSLGLYPNTHEKPPINYDSVTGDMVVCDVIFNDPNTIFLAEAKKRGTKTINGLGMLVNQGALNFTLWTGVEAPKNIMIQTLKHEFNLA